MNLKGKVIKQIFIYLLLKILFEQNRFFFVGLVTSGSQKNRRPQNQKLSKLKISFNA